MTAPGQENAQPAVPPRLYEPVHQPAPSEVRTPFSILALVLGSLAVMEPRPLLGILLMRSLFDNASEAFFFFGGINLFPLMMLALFGSPSEEVLITLFMRGWLRGRGGSGPLTSSPPQVVAGHRGLAGRPVCVLARAGRDGRDADHRKERLSTLRHRRWSRSDNRLVL